MWIQRLLALCVLASVDCQTDVRLPPSIVENPEAQFYCKEASAVTLRCRATGIPAVEYDWKKNDANLNQNLNNIRRVHDGSGSIEIKNITYTDEGYYQCIAKNQYGTAVSNISRLQISVLQLKSEAEVLSQTVNEGDPFIVHIQAPEKSVPSPTFTWKSATGKVDSNPIQLHMSNRMQIAENGDLHFAYAKMEDNLGGKIYKAETKNAVKDLEQGGSYTNVTVLPVPGGAKPFPPRIGFSSDNLTIALEGETVSLQCFFYGNPEPSIDWNGPYKPNNMLPIGRYERKLSGLDISGVVPSDEGNYVCTGTNSVKSTPQTIYVKVEAKPKFVDIVDGPHDVNVTEGNSITFNCSAYAIPGATVKWYRNGKEIDVNAPPKRYSISSDQKKLTIDDLCRDCSDRPESAQSDLTIVQCNASNVHGYAFAAGYVNVLIQTKVALVAEDAVIRVVMNEEKITEFDCSATSDPLTPVTPQWWYTKDSMGPQLVYDDPPEVNLTGGKLVIHVNPNKTQEWIKHQGVYNCTASNGYSYDSKTVVIRIDNYIPPGAAKHGFETYWWILLLLLLMLLLLIIIVCCCCYLLRNKGDQYDVDEKERKNGNDPVKELKSNDFQDYQRPEGQALKGSRGSLNSVRGPSTDDETSLLQEVEDPGKFNEDGSFVGAYTPSATERTHIV